jgi:aminoglycoside phosphotransferase family enzyme/predicted kinase
MANTGPDGRTAEPDDDGRALANRLLDPAAWPHPVDCPVRVIETHISRVFLTGRWAYKVKKPLRLPFLDYGTLERRRAYCEEELRLNRRTAPDLYLDVVAIAGPVASARVGGAGPAIEYAVQMAQFDPDEALDALVVANRVTRDELAALGDDVARFHAAAAPCPAGAAIDGPDSFARVARDNLDELDAAGDPGIEAAARTLRGRLEAEIARLRPVLEARRAAGRVRECHGDLHCGNVVRLDGRLTPFDGIEFDPALRWIDVADDLAFLTMDLAERGRPDLRHAVLQSWFEASGDAGAMRPLPLYEAARALVRAKVAVLHARQHDGDAARLASAARYVAWAQARLDPPRPVLLATCGYSGAGKTYLAARLADALPALHLRSDVERKRLAGLGPLDPSHSPPDAGLYTREFNARTYARLVEAAGDALAGGCPVVVDAASLRRSERADLGRCAAANGAAFAVLHCVAPTDVLRARIAARSRAGTDASEAGVDLVDRQPGYWEPFDDAERRHVVQVDTTTGDPVAAARAGLAALGLA